MVRVRITITIVFEEERKTEESDDDISNTHYNSKMEDRARRIYSL